MSEQIWHVKTPISREDLDAVITGLEVACGGIRIIATETFDLVVKDERQAAALQALFGSNDKVEAVAVKDTEVKMQKKKPEKKHRQQILYTILTGPRAGEEHRGSSLGLMMKSGKLPVGTRIRHPEKGEAILVQDESGKKKWEKVPA